MIKNTHDMDRCGAIFDEHVVRAKFHIVGKNSESIERKMQSTDRRFSQ